MSDLKNFLTQSKEEQHKTVEELATYFTELHGHRFNHNFDSLTEDEILQTTIDNYTQTPSYCERFRKHTS